MLRIQSSFLFALLGLAVSTYGTSTARADVLETAEYRITASTAYETTPTLGNNGTTDLVVFTVKPLVGGVPAAGDIWYQPLLNGAPDGMPVQVTTTATDDQLNDVSGDYIVYTAYDSISSTTGAIVVHQISTGDTHTLGRADIIQEPRIHGTTVVWREGGAFATTVKRFKLAWIGTGMEADVLAGPVPPTFEIQIGERYAVWSEYEGGQYDVYAYDLDDEMERRVTNTPGIDERAPATSGNWIVWEQTVHGATTSTIQGHNQLTHAMPTIASNGAGNFHPSIDGDLVAWESNVASGNLDIWVYRISTGESFQVTTETHDQYLNNVFGNMVAYVDMRRGTEDVWVSSLTFKTVTCESPSHAPSSLNFGEVAIGEPSTQIVTITNDKNPEASLSLENVFFLAGSSPDFAIAAMPPLPASIPPGATVDVPVSFTPMHEVLESAELSIVWSCSANNTVGGFGVRLEGTGLRIPVPPVQQIADILSFMDAAVAGGTLAGDGPGNSASGRLGALRNMIEAAGSMVASGQYAEACDQLRDALNRTDGNPKPPDFVTGPDAAKLAEMIRTLRTDMGCP